MTTASIISIIIAILTALGTILKIFYPLIVAKFSTTQLTAIKIACEIFVYAAEVVYKNQAKSGETKKAYVLNLLKSTFKGVNEEILTAVIEYIGTKTNIFSDPTK